MGYLLYFIGKGWDINGGIPKAAWFISWEIPLKWMMTGVPPFKEASIWYHMVIFIQQDADQTNNLFTWWQHIFSTLNSLDGMMLHNDYFIFRGVWLNHPPAKMGILATS